MANYENELINDVNLDEIKVSQYYLNPCPALPKELYCTARTTNTGVERGHLQYKIDPEVLKKVIIDNQEDINWNIEENSDEYLKRLIPNTSRNGHYSNWKLLLVIKDTTNVCIKGAILNKITNLIALMTSINSRNFIIEKGNRAISSHDPEWFIGHYRLGAPKKFWFELIKRLNLEKITEESKGVIDSISKVDKLNEVKKDNIPKIKKQEIWEQYIGIDIGRTKCLCCNLNDITQFNFHNGHILAKSKGGDMSKENLRPICSQCNLSMGNESMIDFMNRLKYDTSKIKIKKEEIKDENKIIVKCNMRNNQWGKHNYVFDTIRYTQKIISPWGHWKDTNKLFEEGKFNNAKYSNIFINDLKINDHVCMYDREYDYALVLKIISEPIAEKIKEIIILRNSKCLHKPLISDCKNCTDSIELVFTNKYFEENPEEFTKYMNEDYQFENMYGITRKIKIVGIIDDSCEFYRSGKMLQNSISRSTSKILETDIYNDELDDGSFSDLDEVSYMD